MLHRAPKAPPARRISDMLAAAVSSNVANAKSVVAKPDSRPKRLQTASSRSPARSIAKAMPRYAQPTQSACSRTTQTTKTSRTANITQNPVMQTRTKRPRSPLSATAGRPSKRARIYHERDSLDPTDLDELSYMHRDLELLKLERLGRIIAACPRYGTAAGSLIPHMRAHSTEQRTLKFLVGTWKIPRQASEATTRSKPFLSMTMRSKIPLSNATLQKRSAAQISRPTPEPAASTTATGSVMKVEACPMPAVERPPTSHNTTATIAPKAVRFSEGPVILRRFDPGETPSFVNVEYTGEWGRLRPQGGGPRRLYPGRSTARGGKAVWEPVPGAARACSLKNTFLARYKSVQSYDQLREADAKARGLELSDVQFAYGTIDYKIDLSATGNIQGATHWHSPRPFAYGEKVADKY